MASHKHAKEGEKAVHEEVAAANGDREEADNVHSIQEEENDDDWEKVPDEEEGEEGALDAEGGFDAKYLRAR